MSKGKNQKLKLVYLIKILLDQTDQEHGITMAELLQELDKYDVTGERKSIYDDIRTIQEFGIAVEKRKKGSEVYYHVVSRYFELAELKLLVDAVQASKFITIQKSDELIKKLGVLTSVHEKKNLQRQVAVLQRAKASNEEIFQSVDKIHTAIMENKNIRFQYFDWNIKKKRELRHHGNIYVVSPYALLWEDENYYLIGYDNQTNMKKHYRVDRMLNLEISNEKRIGQEEFTKFNIATYSNKVFGMFGGKETKVTLRFKNSFAGVPIEQFGRDIMMIPSGENHFNIHVDVNVSSQFYGWVFALGENVKILQPEAVVSGMKDALRQQLEMYGKNV